MVSISPKLPWELMNPKLAAAVNPLLGNPLVNGQILPDIVLVSGRNTVVHGLGRKLQGYFVILNAAAATFYDSQGSNQRPDLTLWLNASGATTVSLYVF